MRATRRAAAAAVILVSLAGMAGSAAPAAAQEGTPGVSAATAILVSLPDRAHSPDDARVVFARRVHDVRAPASLTKVVTALVARDEYGLDEVVEVSPLVLRAHGSRLHLEPGMRVTVRDLLYALLLKSANDAGTALAAHHPSGYDHFIALMNQKARALGARNTRMRNPHGLDQIGHVSTAWDMALFTRELLADPVLSRVVATKTYRMPWKDGDSRIFDHHHKMIGRYEGAVGVKTGYTLQAGHCLITAARTSAGIAFSVVMGSQDHYADTTALLDFGKALEARATSGGGALEAGQALEGPPELGPDAVVAAAAPSGGFDPRDDERWLALMVVLAGLSVATVGIRRRSHPLHEAAEVLPWLEPLAAASERRPR